MMIALSIIMVVLSIAVGIGTWIYLRKSDNSSSLTYKDEKDEEKESPKGIIDMSSEKLSIDDISNSVITLENFKKKSVILKIKNSDFNMLSEDGQSITEDVLRQLSLSLQYDIGFYSTTRTIDTSKPLNSVNKVINSIENEYIQAYSINYKNFLNGIMMNERVAEREDYVILTYIGDMSLSIKELERRALQVINSFKKINTKCDIITSENIMDLIYHDLNRNDFFNPSSAIKLGALNLYHGESKKEV